MVLLRPGNAGSNTAADHITVLREALRQLSGAPGGDSARTQDPDTRDSAGGIHELLNWLVEQRLPYSVGFTTPDTIADISRRSPSCPAALLECG